MLDLSRHVVDSSARGVDPRPTITNDAPQVIPTTMRAWIHVRAGKPIDVLTFSSDVKTPSILSPTDVLVRTSHAALNPGASIMMQLCPSFLRHRPAIPELDFSGTIADVGTAVPGSRKLVPGTPVFGSVGVASHLRGGVGALAEYIVVPATAVVRKPTAASFEEMAGLAVTGCTAIPLLERAELKKGDSVLINGASGGIGTLVVQLAREAVGDSGRVVAICSERNRDTVTALGADEVIDYHGDSPLETRLASLYCNSRFSAIIDAHGSPNLYTCSAEYLRPGKPFVSVGVAFEAYTYFSMFRAVYLMLKHSWWSQTVGAVSRAYIGVTGVISLALMERLGELVEQKRLKVVIDSCWELNDVLKGYDILLSGRAKGKVIISICKATAGIH